MELSSHSWRRAMPQTLRTLFIFGDSLCDPGNLAFPWAQAALAARLPPRRWQDRFCDGPVFPEYLADRLGLDVLPVAAGLGTASVRRLQAAFSSGGINFAFSSARSGTGGSVPGLLAQCGAQEGVNGFLGYRQLAGQWRTSARPDSLFLITGGANDYTSSVLSPVGQVERTAHNLRIVLQTLKDGGAGRCVLMGLPDLGLAPAARAMGPLASRAAASLSRTHNAMLTRLAATLGDRSFDVRTYDSFAISRQLWANEARQQLYFVDAIHPATWVHRAIANDLLAHIASWWPGWLPSVRTRPSRSENMAPVA